MHACIYVCVFCARIGVYACMYMCILMFLILICVRILSSFHPYNHHLSPNSPRLMFLFVDCATVNRVYLIYLILSYLKGVVMLFLSWFKPSIFLSSCMDSSATITIKSIHVSVSVTFEYLATPAIDCRPQTPTSAIIHMGLGLSREWPIRLRIIRIERLNISCL